QAIAQHLGDQLPAGPEPALPVRTGAVLSDAPPATELERRHLTVVFCDLVDSTALSTRLDPEDLRRLVGRYQRHASLVITRFGGFPAQFMGDGVMAYFGYPVAHEDDAERAVRAGMALVEELSAADIAPGARIAVRVGIATGEVVVGGTGVAGRSSTSGAVGETPKIAAQIQSVGAPGSVLIAASTRRLVGGAFEYRELGRRLITGLAERVAVSQVLRLSGAASRFEARNGVALAPLVGRDDELERLTQRWVQALAARGQVVLVCAEPGIGKSRIAAALRDAVLLAGSRVMQYFCSPYHSESPLHPFIEHLARACGGAAGGDPGNRTAMLADLFGLDAAGSSADLGLLCEALSVGETRPFEPFDGGPHQKKARLFEMLTAYHERAQATEPVLLVFEDAHWADSTSLKLLGRLIERAADWRLMIVITHRPEFVPPWADATHLGRVVLDRLDRQAATLIVHRVAEGRSLPPVVLEDILNRTDGVPLFIEELTSAILESGLLRPTPAGFELTGAFSTLAVPRSLNASLLARLDRLESVKSIAQIGACIGREFGHRLLAGVAGLPQAQLDEALARLVASGLVLERAQDGVRSFAFKHALIQEVAYSTLVRGRRQALHARIAATLEAQAPDAVASQPEILARHLAQADQGEPAARAYLRAGRLAQSRSSDIEACAHLRRGLELLAGIAPGNARDDLELTLQSSLGIALSAANGYADGSAVVAFERARALTTRGKDINEIGPVYTGLFISYSNRAEFNRALEVADEFMALVDGSPDLIAKSMANRMVAACYRLMGKIKLSLPYGERAMQLALEAADSGQVWRLTHDPLIAAKYSLALTLWHCGEAERSIALEQDALGQARRVNHANTLGFALAYIGCMSAYRRGDFEALAPYCDQLSEHGQRYSRPMWQSMARIFRGRLMVERGDPQGGMREIEQGIEAYQRIQMRINVPHYLGMLSEACLACDRVDDALHALDRAIALSRQSGDRAHLPELWRLRARASLAAGTPDALAACAHDLGMAIEYARDQGSVSYERRAALDLALLPASSRGAATVATEASAATIRALP
nr:adenylate/guanylate cyclase domain-containing protein [Burkholderiaceae bacterium]